MPHDCNTNIYKIVGGERFALGFFDLFATAIQRDKKTVDLIKLEKDYVESGRSAEYLKDYYDQMTPIKSQYNYAIMYYPRSALIESEPVTESSALLESPNDVERGLTSIVGSPEFAEALLRSEKLKHVAAPEECMEVMDLSRPLANLVDNLDASFADTLFKLIERKGKTDAEIYKKANIDRRLFSKIRTQKNYTPKKQTILALAIALELSLSETSDLLERAGYALSHANKFDVIVEYFIVRKKYNIFNINEVLFKYDQPLLGC